MANFRKYFLIAIILLGSISCKKDVNTNPSSTTAPYMSASCNNTFVVFTGSVKVAYPQYQINGVSSGNSNIQIIFNAPTIGIYKIGYQQATFTVATGESWQTNTSDTGSINISALTSNSITGSFSFNALETRPTAGASVESVTSGGFYLTW